MEIIFMSTKTKENFDQFVSRLHTVYLMRYKNEYNHNLSDKFKIVHDRSSSDGYKNDCCY